MRFNDPTGHLREMAASEPRAADRPNVIPFARRHGIRHGKPPGALRVLLVEDDELDIRLFLLVADQLGIPSANIAVARSIAEAHALIAGETFDRFVMDYWLGAETTDALIAAVLAEPLTWVTVVSNFASEELRAIKGPPDRLHLVSKCELTTTSLAEALGLGTPAGPKAAVSAAEAPAVPVSDFALVNLKDELAQMRRMAERIAMTLRLADSHLCEGESDEAHIFVVETMNLHRRIEAKLDGLERQITRRLLPRLP